jgi:hypothetical protein
MSQPGIEPRAPALYQRVIHLTVQICYSTVILRNSDGIKIIIGLYLKYNNIRMTVTTFRDKSNHGTHLK